MKKVYKKPIVEMVVMEESTSICVSSISQETPQGGNPAIAF